jgi:hypothetical protein
MRTLFFTGASWFYWMVIVKAWQGLIQLSVTKQTVMLQQWLVDNTSAMRRWQSCTSWCEPVSGFLPAKPAWNGTAVVDVHRVLDSQPGGCLLLNCVHVCCCRLVRRT